MPFFEECLKHVIWIIWTGILVCTVYRISHICHFLLWSWVGLNLDTLFEALNIDSTVQLSFHGYSYTFLIILMNEISILPNWDKNELCCVSMQTLSTYYWKLSESAFTVIYSISWESGLFSYFWKRLRSGLNTAIKRRYVLELEFSSEFLHISNGFMVHQCAEENLRLSQAAFFHSSYYLCTILY